MNYSRTVKINQDFMKTRCKKESPKQSKTGVSPVPFVRTCCSIKTRRKERLTFLKKHQTGFIQALSWNIFKRIQFRITFQAVQTFYLKKLGFNSCNCTIILSTSFLNLALIRIRDADHVTKSVYFALHSSRGLCKLRWIASFATQFVESLRQSDAPSWVYFRWKSQYPRGIPMACGADVRWNESADPNRGRNFDFWTTCDYCSALH